MSRHLDARKYQATGMHAAVFARVNRRRTVPPSEYTEAALLEDMMDAHKFASSAADREILERTGGIGTARTRVSIIAEQLSKGAMIAPAPFLTECLRH
jgi:DNA topoisomerase IA